MKFKIGDTIVVFFQDQSYRIVTVIGTRPGDYELDTAPWSFYKSREIDECATHVDDLSDLERLIYEI